MLDFQSKISRKVYIVLYFLSIAVVTFFVEISVIPVHTANIFILPLLLAVLLYKDRTYLVLLVPSIALGIYLSYHFAPSFSLSLITIIMISIALVAFAEIVLHYFKKTNAYEVALKKSRDKFELLLNYTYDWEYWIQPDGKLGYSSPSCFQQTGYTREEFLNDKELILKIVHPDDKEIVAEHFKNLNSDKPYRLEFKIIKRSGKVKVLRHTCQPIYDSEGNFIGRRATNRNATDRWLAEQSLKESERKFRNIFNSLLDVYYRTKLDGTIELISPSVEKVGGYKPEELIGKDASLFYKNKADREAFLKKIKEKGMLSNYDVEFLDAKGNTKIFSFNTKLVRDEEGNPVAIEGMFRDVTEIREKEKALQRAETQAKRYLEIANVMILVLDREANIKLINKKGTEILGQPQEKLLNKNFYDLYLPEEEKKAQKESYRKLMEEERGLAGDYENTIVVKGNKLKIHWHSTLLRDDDGKIIGLLTSGIDVTKEKLLKEKLEDEKNKYQALFESNITGVFLAKTDGTIIECNVAFAKLFDFENPEAVKGQNIFDFSYNAEVKEKLSQKLMEEKAIVSDELSMRKRNGEKICILANISFVGNEYLQGTLVDISKRKEMESKLRESEKELRELNEAKDKFFSIIAHDIRSPFTALLGYTQLLLEEYETASKEELGVYIRNLDRTSKNIFKFIDGLLEWTRTQAGRIELNVVNANLFSEVESIVQLSNESASQKGIEISNVVNKNITVETDENVLNTVLRNLITNAIKFTDKGGKIVIDAMIENDNVVVSIEDNGVGISQENISKLFRIDSYFTTPGTQKEAGTGLGLLLCKELVEKQGGKIWVESKEGEGSKFSFSIPIGKRQEQN